MKKIFGKSYRKNGKSLKKIIGKMKNLRKKL